MSMLSAGQKSSGVQPDGFIMDVRDAKNLKNSFALGAVIMAVHQRWTGYSFAKQNFYPQNSPWMANFEE
ncbi:MAG: hypothetical protein LBK77_01360, partial [Spirochaetaceae bacterium]|nr:hypothetical protein [Spirochaetaceae bacterium]